MSGHAAGGGRSNEHAVCHAACVTGNNIEEIQMEFNLTVGKAVWSH